MRAWYILGALFLVVTGVFSFEECPHHCTCTQSSFTGGKAKCSVLDPDIQKFPLDIVHLTVDNYPDERLPARLFIDLGLSQLVTLRIANGTLRNINRHAFQGLTYLEDVDLPYNKIEKLDPHTFESLNVKRLNLDGNPLVMYDSNVPNELRQFLISTSLIELTLSDCKIKSVEEVQTLTNLASLEYLDLSYNELTELKDDMFSSLINLEEINLSHNKIKHIDRDTFADIDDLSTLNLRGNPLVTLEGIEIPGLNELDVSHCKFELLSASTLEGFPELTSLNLSQNSIMNIDMDTFMSVPGLKNLDLSYNKLRGPLSELLFEFNKKLETLSFRGNSEIKYMPGFKGEFPLLYTYDLSYCGLTSIGNETFKGMNNLATVNVSGNSLVHIDPRTFINLHYLTVLDLSSNLLHVLHSKIFLANKELTKLNLARNFFKHLPAVLFLPTPKLQWLDLSYCRLTSLCNISESFTMRNHNILSRLTYLNLSGNKLTKLHKHYFVSMVKLKKLDISNNPIECTPDFSHVMQWLIIKRVMPNKITTESPASLDLIENNVQWDDILKTVCPLEPSNYKENNSVMFSSNVIHIPDIGTFEAENSDIEVPIIEETTPFGPMLVVWVSLFLLLFAMINLIGLTIYRSRKNYKIVSSALDGHFQVRKGGRQQYQKLYEECSIPVPIHNEKKISIVASIIGNAMGKNDKV